VAAAVGIEPRGEPIDQAARLLGLAESRRAWPFIEAAADTGQLDVHLPNLDPGPTAFEAAHAVLGDAWPSLVGVVGDELARSVVVRAVRNLTSALMPVARVAMWRGANRPDAAQAMQPGQFDALTPILAAARDVLGGTLWRHRAGREARVAVIDARLELARSAGPWWALDGLAIACERPLVIRRDDQARFHSADGPAVAWSDGTALYAWHGLRVDARVILHPETLTVADIDDEDNAEVRRVLVERFGPERLVREGNAFLVHEDETGRLWRRVFAAHQWGSGRDEPVVMVEVTNSTPEPDGSHRTYWLRVPPGTMTAREGVAWTFGMGAAAWRPAAET
jgi:hypothetical protein